MDWGDYRHISSNPKDVAWDNARDRYDREIARARSWEDEERAKKRLDEEWERIYSKK